MLERLITFIAKKFGKRVVIEDRKTSTPYLIRYILFSSKWFSIYVHRFLISDKGEHHDHPWNFYTWVITKGYKEEQLAQDLTDVRGTYIDQDIYRKPGSIAYRSAESLHRVIIDREYTVEEENIAPLTVCFIGRRRRVWGFAWTDKVNTLRWVNWADYLQLNQEEIDEAMKGKAI